MVMATTTVMATVMATATATAMVMATAIQVTATATRGPMFDLGTPDMPVPELVPVKISPNLESITFYERTGVAAPILTFLVDGPELTVRLADPLAIGNFDIDGATGEFYDVHYLG